MSYVFLNCDCMDKDKGMPSYPDKHFELAIVDPPYGIEQTTGRETNHGRGKLKDRAFNQGEKKFGVWDIRPSAYYFAELKRVSKNQIIWGGNYFELPPNRCMIVWDKCQPWENFSQVELAWTSFDSPALLYKYDNRYGGKIHPTQKPIALYKWLLTKYAKPGDKILDTHVGSASSIIACIDLGFDVTGFELDADYYKAATKRINDFKSQLKIF